MKSQPNINFRYVLKPDLSESITKTFKQEYLREDVAVYDDENYEWRITDDEFSNIYSFYVLISDKQEPIEDLIEFEVVVLSEIEIINSPVYDFYKVQSDPAWAHKGTIDVKMENRIKNFLVDEMLTPEILIHTKPCSIDGNKLYPIVRQYIKDHIDPKYAEITSDYAFCFTVVKKVMLAKSYETQQEILTSKGKSFRTKKYRKNLHTNRKVEVFEMTPPEKQYGKYTVLKGIDGQNHEDLQEKIEVYLKSLMVMINEPLIECNSCKGTGVILDDNYKIK
jgi:hypothetical protein